MRILMVSPHPVYSPRGTPISVFNRCLALAALGHEIDLVTYPIGEDVPLPGLRYLRASFPGICAVRVGPSWAKVFLNGSVALRTVREVLARKQRYDVIHTHEEAGLIGWTLGPLHRLPHIYDMGNDWGVVLANYGLASDHLLTRAAEALEARVFRTASGVIAHFPAIAARVQSRASTPVDVIYNVALDDDPVPDEVAKIRRAWSPDGRALIVYVGTLEPYQGIERLLEAMAAVSTSARLVIVGGRPDQIAAFDSRSETLGLGDVVHFAGTLDSSLIPACLAAADVLVSPRAKGSNTPLKVFSYLRAGVPIVATRIESHTQVLGDHNAILVEPSARGLAEGIEAALVDARRGKPLKRCAADARELFAPREYLRGVATAYLRVGGPPVDDTVLDVAVRRLHEWQAARSRRQGAVPSILEKSSATSRSTHPPATTAFAS